MHLPVQGNSLVRSVLRSHVACDVCDVCLEVGDTEAAQCTEKHNTFGEIVSHRSSVCRNKQ